MSSETVWGVGLLSLLIDGLIWGVAACTTYRWLAGPAQRWLGPSVVAGLIFVVERLLQRLAMEVELIPSVCQDEAETLLPEDPIHNPEVGRLAQATRRTSRARPVPCPRLAEHSLPSTGRSP